MDNKENMVEENEVKESKSWGLWTVAIVLCLLIWFFGAWGMRTMAYSFYTTSSTVEIQETKGDTHSKKDISVPALFGDSFGAVNALISALAFAGLIVTFFLQRDELQMQRKELELQRNEFATQNSTMKMQRFENTFFHMMELHQQIVSDLKIQVQYSTRARGSSEAELMVKTYSGRSVFEYLYAHRPIGSDKDAFYGLKYYLEENNIEDYLEEKEWFILDHYYMHLYTILSFIDTNIDISSFQEKYKYAKMLRATLSRYELVLLYYNGLAHYNLALKPLMEKYCILNNLDTSLLSLCKTTKDLIMKRCYIKKEESINVLSDYVLTNEKFITTLNNNNIEPTDFAFYLTINSDAEAPKYCYTAFYHSDEKDVAEQKIKQVEKLLNKTLS